MTALARRPPPTGMTTELWLAVPITVVAIEALTRTQPVKPVLPDTDGSWCGDPFPHVVEVDGALVIEDGHHRIDRAVARGDRNVPVRLIRSHPSARR